MSAHSLPSDPSRGSFVGPVKRTTLDRRPNRQGPATQDRSPAGDGPLDGTYGSHGAAPIVVRLGTRDPTDLGTDGRHDRVEVADHRVVGAGEDRRVGVGVDGEDPLALRQPTMCWMAPLMPHAM